MPPLDSTSTSLHALSVKNPRFSVHPLFWTERHLLFVKCVFQERFDEHREVTARKDHHEHLTACAKDLATDPCAVLKRCWVEDLLTRPGGHLAYDNHMVDFFYAKRRVLNIWCDVFRPAENITLPDTPIGFYRYDADQKRRKKLHVRPSHDNRPNDPVKRLFERKFQSVTPEDWRNDPFIVCILISLAQRLVRKKQLAKVYFTRLLVTNMSDKTHAYIYKADFPHQLLECFDRPARPMDDVVFPTIDYTAVRFQPYATFSERLEIHLLGAGDASSVAVASSSKE
ncbi:Ff.00g039630.m01.CDS01 [Fusarium sp. VM40]|nr:Ff.00g039630.m01.CDS01 [Fusarium sp. VM40]